MKYVRFYLVDRIQNSTKIHGGFAVRKEVT